MLERDVIQMRGFHNIEENGQITGFQFRVRLTYYRGLWLSMLRPGDVTVDGETVPKEDTTWEICGVEYSLDEMKELSNVQWPMQEAAVIRVKKPGGLSQGLHEVGIVYRFIMSYIPPVVNSDKAFARQPAKPYTRKLLIV